MLFAPSFGDLVLWERLQLEVAKRKDVLFLRFDISVQVLMLYCSWVH